MHADDLRFLRHAFVLTACVFCSWCVLKAILIPIVYALLLNIIRWRCSAKFSPFAAVDDVHHFVLVLLISFAFTNVFTGGLKVTAGRYRPDWYARQESNDTDVCML